MWHRAHLTACLATAALLAFALVSIRVDAQEPGSSALDVPYVPTPIEVVDMMLKMADVGPSDFVIDLGSGDGRIAIAAAKLGARALGVDLDPQRVEEATHNARKAGLQDRVIFKRQNLFDTEIADATVLTMYLLTKVNMDLRPRILGELKPGTRVVSHAFNLGNWQPDQEGKLGYRQVFMWTVPAKVAGRWQGEIGAASLSLELDQKFQYFSGKATVDGRTVDVREGGLRGTAIRFTLADGRKFHGRVSGDAMEALPQSEENTAGNWRASRTP
jgi:SAM-dependent methyltransferase